MFIRLFLIAFLIPVQSCSNSLIGEKLENSFDINENRQVSVNTIKVKEKNKQKQTKKIKSNKKNERKENENFQVSNNKKNSTPSKNRFSQASTKPIKKVIFNPKPYRIILKLSGANPSAPSESVTKALIKAGVQFEVEKIERLDEKNILKTSSVQR